MSKLRPHSAFLAAALVNEGSVIISSTSHSENIAAMEGTFERKTTHYRAESSNLGWCTRSVTRWGPYWKLGDHN